MDSPYSPSSSDHRPRRARLLASGTATPAGATTAQLARRWIVDQPGVTTVIPGARNPHQARANAVAADLLPLDGRTLADLRAVYDARIHPLVHHRW